LSKRCAICGDSITFLSENKISQNHSDIKICFTCYEYVATAHKGSRKAVEIIKGRYREDVSDKVVKYINSLEKDIMPKESKKREDTFMELMNNDLSELKKKEDKQKASPKNNIIRLDKLSEAKKDRLIRIRIISTILTYVFGLFGFLFSIYILTQGYGAMLALVTLIMSAGFTAVFGFIKTVLSVILDE